MIHNAIEFATLAHKNQFRKSTKIPYVVHLFEVATILAQNGASDDVICAGILHDTLEDTDTTTDDLLKNFSEKITNLVIANSENKSLSWEERKQHTIDYIKNKATTEELMVICADKLSNIRSLSADYKKIGDSLYNRFNRGYDKQKWYYGQLLLAMDKMQDYKMYQEFKELYTEVFEQ